MKKTAVVLAVAAVLGFCLSWIVYRPDSVHSIFSTMMASLFVAFCAYMTADCFYRESSRSFIGLSSRKAFIALLGVSLAAGVLLEAGTLLGSRVASISNLDDWHATRVLFFMVLVYGVMIFRMWYWRPGHFAGIVQEIACLLKEIEPRRALFAAIALGIVLLVGFVFGSHFGLSIKSVGIFSIAVGFSVAASILLWRYHGEHPEYLFVVIALTAGLYMIFELPSETMVSWDDETHYARAISLSYLDGEEASDAEESLRKPSGGSGEALGRPESDVSTSKNRVAWSESSIKDYEVNLDGAFSEEGYRVAGSGETAKVQYDSLGWTPAAIGLWMARLFHLTPSLSFKLGKLFILLFYVVICATAIRVIPVKKTFLSAASLIPTQLFLASNYSYDTWVSCLTFLAIALVVRQMVNKDELLDVRAFSAIAIAFLLGLAPKPIYFPLIGLMLLVPKCKFETQRGHRAFYVGACILALVIMVSFVAPFLSSTGVGDTRGDGGSGAVNAFGQVQFVLAHPFAAGKTILSFIFDSYLSADFTNMFILAFAYLGNVQDHFLSVSVWPFVFLVVVAIADNFSEERICGFRGKAWTGFVGFCAVLLVVLSMYVMFNAVGAEKIEGVQGRYLLPVLIPVLAILSSTKLANRSDKRVFSAASLLLSGGLLFFSEAALIVLRIAA